MVLTGYQQYYILTAYKNKSLTKQHQSPILNPLLPESSLKITRQCLLVILPAIMAKPIVAISQTTDIERVEMLVDSNAAEEQYRLARAMGVNMGVNMGYYAVDKLGSHLRKRNTPTCSTDCGKPSIKNCTTLFERLDHGALDFPVVIPKFEKLL